VKLFAMDLDGTLVARDGSIHPRDAEAIAAARANGVVMTIATGRLTSGTRGVATELGLDAPLVCADGGVIACGATWDILERRPIATEHVASLLERFADGEIASFVFTHDEIHSCERGRAHHPYVQGWSPKITTHRDVAQAPAWRDEPDAAVMVVGIGRADRLDQALGACLEVHGEVDRMTFTFGASTVVRFVGRGASKASGLEAVARRLGVARRDVAVVGDWYNDVSMLRWAGRSFAMPHAPEDVKSEATDVVAAEHAGRGAVAAAIEAWLSSSGDPGGEPATS
jgi:hypothetical protein